MTSFRARASDNIHWMEHVLRTDLRYQTDQGNAYTCSDRWEIAAGATEYLEFRIPVGTTVRVYDRITSTSGDDFNFDLCVVDSITPGDTEFSFTNMKVGGADPDARIWRGATNPVNLKVKEYTFFPSASTGNSSGAIQVQEAYRVLTGSDVPSILRVENTGGNPQTFGMIVLFTERADD